MKRWIHGRKYNETPAPALTDTVGTYDRSKFRGNRGSIWNNIAVREILINWYLQIGCEVQALCEMVKSQV